ncbi:hypothetical protein I79_001062 [Cricetulus griseus]|uniref:Uncharacterized protein n=1 Tax=Cricetulus griseus TaxID=10029 RepID=G3GTS3_CRIGR|nr:hypothetical protein I79_001062 [Cricetulus griseus]
MPEPFRRGYPILQENHLKSSPSRRSTRARPCPVTGPTQASQTESSTSKRHPRSAFTSGPQRIPAPRLQLLLLLATHNRALRTR